MSEKISLDSSAFKYKIRVLDKYIESSYNKSFRPGYITKSLPNFIFKHPFNIFL